MENNKKKKPVWLGHLQELLNRFQGQTSHFNRTSKPVRIQWKAHQPFAHRQILPEKGEAPDHQVLPYIHN